jgi:hypothetical protein
MTDPEVRVLSPCRAGLLFFLSSVRNETVFSEL